MAKGANIANVTVAVTPTFPGLGKAVRSAFDTYGVAPAKASGAKAGGAFGESFGSGLVKSGAVIGAASEVVSRAMSAVSASMDAAISRFDLLNNYPKAMQSLGYETREVNASLSTMDERLQGLPTSLDSMVGLVQGLVVTTNDLGLATDAGLALNDMLIASGSNTQLASAAMEQFRQMLAKGKPEMEDWRSLTSAMPGQMDQLAKSMLGASATASDLYYALGGGKENDSHMEGLEFASVSTEQLLQAMIRLDKEGGEGIASFEEQARTASGGIETSMANLQTAVTRGLAGTLEAVGKDSVADAFSGAKDAVNGAFKAVNSAVSAAMPAVKGLAETVSGMVPQIAAGAAAFAAFKTAGGAISSVAPKASALGEALKLAAGGAGTLGESMRAVGLRFDPVSLGITAVATAAGLAAAAFADWKRKSDNAEKATTGLNDAVARATAIKGYSGTLKDVGSSAESAALDIDGLNEKLASNADRMDEVTSSAKGQLSELNTAQQIVNQYAGETDLSAQAQGRLEWALNLLNEQFGLNVSAQDAAIGKYTDQTGAVRDLKDSVNELIEAKNREVEIDALSENLSIANENADAAADAYADYYSSFDEKAAKYATQWAAVLGQGGGVVDYKVAEQLGVEQATKELKELEAAAKSAEEDVNAVYDAMGDASRAAGEGADAFDAWGNSLSRSVKAVLERNAGANGLALLKEDLRDLGVSPEDIAEDESSLMRLAAAYDGTAASIIGSLDSMGVRIDDTARKQAEAASAMRDAIAEWGTDLGGIDVSTFADKLAEAGVSVEQLNKVGSLNMSELAASCNGNIDLMVWAVQHYNDTPILDKDGRVQVDQASLVDAQGNVYEWNDGVLYDKGGAVVVDDASLMDAQGHVWTWDAEGGRLVDKHGNAVVDSNVSEVNGDISEYRSAPSDLGTKSGTVNIFRNIIDGAKSFLGIGNAAGGVRLNAQGGVRFHAGGAIATRAVPLDIVGEAGAEAIVPLTNRRYAQPFADLIAERVNAGRDDDGARAVVAWLSANLPAIIEQHTPVMGERDFARMTRKAVANG